MWNPSYQDLSRGTALVNITRQQIPKIVEWSFTADRKRLLPFAHVITRSEIDGLTFWGSGCDFSWILAARKSLAEAWERAIMSFSDSPHGPATIKSSNGFAAGRTIDTAINAARAELIERAILLQAWSNYIGWRPISPIGWINSVMISLLRREGWNLRFFIVEEQTTGGCILAALLLHPERGVHFDSEFCCHPQDKISQQKLLLSILRNYYIMDEIAPLTELPEDGGPEDHMRFYKNTDHICAFDFLFKLSANDTPKLVLEDPELIKCAIASHEDILPTVAVSWHEKWPALRWGKNSISGINPWPHPLA